MTSIPPLKRLFDLAGAAGGLLAFSPVMALVAAAVLLEDGRPGLFRQADALRASLPRPPSRRRDILVRL